MRMYPWLPERASFGDKPACDNCKRFGDDCGSWEEAEQIQMMLIGGENGKRIFP